MSEAQSLNNIVTQTARDENAGELLHPSPGIFWFRVPSARPAPSPKEEGRLRLGFAIGLQRRDGRAELGAGIIRQGGLAQGGELGGCVGAAIESRRVARMRS